MSATQIVQVVPALPPRISGVGDYAYLLARQLRAAHDIDTRFLISDPAWREDQELDGFKAERLAARSAVELRSRLSAPGMPSTVLLHYVGYGYEKRGCPFWLVRGLEAWRKAQRDLRLTVMFHEVAADRGPFPSSSFFNASLQNWLAMRLARAADFCRTNMRRYARRLERMAPRHAGKVIVRPVFSTVGEPECLRSWSERKSWLVVFGGTGWIKRAFSEHQAVLLRCCRALKLNRIVIVGSIDCSLPAIPMAIDCCGAMPAEDVSRVLINCRAGWLSCPVAFLGKSTIFAAYASHAVIPILPDDGENEDGLRRGREYLTAADIAEHSSDSNPASLGKRTNIWYQGHAIKKTACDLAEQLM